MIKKILILTIITSSFLIIGPSVAAQGEILPLASGTATCNPPAGVDPATYCGNYTVDDFMVLIVNVSRWILGIVGSLSLLMFIYGGFMFLISAGASEKIEKAKKIIIAAVIGLIIVFSSWLAIRFVLQTLNPNISWTGQKLTPKDF